MTAGHERPPGFEQLLYDTVDRLVRMELGQGTPMTGWPLCIRVPRSGPAWFACVTVCSCFIQQILGVEVLETNPPSTESARMGDQVTQTAYLDRDALRRNTD